MKTRGICAALTAPLLLALSGAFLIIPRSSTAQQQGDDSGYRTSESTQRLDPQDPEGYIITDKAADNGDLKKEGPVRMARFAFVSGNVTWRDGASGDWSQATVNTPLRQGAEILVLKGGRADLQFDDGSSLRLGNGALVSLKTLFSDDKGEFTQITLKDGLATLHSRHTDAVYQVDTPMVSVKSVGPSQIRFGVDGGSEVAVQSGSATVEGQQGKTTVKEGYYLYLASANSEYKTRPLPGKDAWDNWNSDRNRLIAGTSETYRHVPPNIGLVAEDMDGYGSWHNDPKYGWVWSPSGQQADWRPYNNGNWTWVDPYGWTWVSNEPWGWAPYHYGTWCQLSWGWSWCPGPRFQYWSPGVVSFCSFGDRIGWAPLCPWEVQYPTFCSLGIWGSSWCFDFSIGWAGCYFPFGREFCEGRRFDNHFVNAFNHDRFGEGRFTPLGRLNNSLEGHTSAVNHAFIPFNVRSAAGATSASTAAFGGRGSYQRVAKGDTSLFSSGRTVSSAARGVPVSGPTSVTPTAIARTPSRSFVAGAPSQAAAGRTTYQAALPSSVSRTASPGAGSVSSSGGVTSPGVFRGSTGASLPAAEAARQARASLGNYSGTSGNSRSGVSTGGYSGRSTGGAGDVPRSSGYGGYNGGSGSRSYGGGGAAPSYRVGPTYRGSSSSGSSAGSSSGGRSGGSSSGGGGGGGRSAPSGGGGRH